MTYALMFIVIILAAGLARLYVRRRYNTDEEKNIIREALKRNNQARVRNSHVSN